MIACHANRYVRLYVLMSFILPVLLLPLLSNDSASALEQTNVYVNGCLMLPDESITVYAPNVRFEAYPSVPSGFDVPTTPEALNESERLLTWHFGDGGNADSEKVLHHYDSEGAYNVFLSANEQFNSGGLLSVNQTAEDFGVTVNYVETLCYCSGKMSRITAQRLCPK